MLKYHKYIVKAEDTPHSTEDIQKVSQAVIDHMLTVSKGSPLGKYVDAGAVNRYVWEVLNNLHETDNVVLCYAYDKQGICLGLVGCVFFCIFSDWYTTKPMLLDRLVICVDNRFRGFGRIGAVVLKELMKENHCVCMFDGVDFAADKAMLAKGMKKRLGDTMDSYELNEVCYINREE